MRYPSNQKPYVWFESYPTNQWINAKVALPANNDNVFICNEDQSRIGVGFYEEQQWSAYNDRDSDWVTAWWMPIPKLPK